MGSVLPQFPRDLLLVGVTLNPLAFSPLHGLHGSLDLLIKLVHVHRILHGDAYREFEIVLYTYCLVICVAKKTFALGRILC